MQLTLWTSLLVAMHDDIENTGTWGCATDHSILLWTSVDDSTKDGVPLWSDLRTVILIQVGKGSWYKLNKSQTSLGPPFLVQWPIPE